MSSHERDGLLLLLVAEPDLLAVGVCQDQPNPTAGLALVAEKIDELGNQFRQEANGVAEDVDLTISLPDEVAPLTGSHTRASRERLENLLFSTVIVTGHATGVGPQVLLVLLHELAHRPAETPMRSAPTEPVLNSLRIDAQLARNHIGRKSCALERGT